MNNSKLVRSQPTHEARLQITEERLEAKGITTLAVLDNEGAPCNQLAEQLGDLTISRHADMHEVLLASNAQHVASVLPMVIKGETVMYDARRSVLHAIQDAGRQALASLDLTPDSQPNILAVVASR